VNADPESIRLAGALPSAEWRSTLAGEGLGLRIGPFDVHLTVPIKEVAASLQALYGDHPLLGGERVYAVRARLDPVWHFGRRPGRRVRFSVDGLRPHEDMPPGQGLAVLEWGLNLAIAMRFHCFLLLHSAVLERNGRALLMPASPGHGKTTLCAALAHRGWRLLSDEFGILRPGTTDLIPVPRPMPLKNESIDVIRSFEPNAAFGPVIPGTRKGVICHVKPPAGSVARADEAAPARWIVFPRWSRGVPLTLEDIGPGEGFMQLATNAFNYELLGEPAFDTVGRVVASSRCLRLVYADLERAVDALTRLADHDG
jgi:HprK-related kinase A